MAKYCRLCGFSSFRKSRFQFKFPDLAQLLLLRLPMRCLNCDERDYASIKQYLEMRRARRVRRRTHRDAI